MFAPQVKGTANATAGGFGNTGGGAAQILMPFNCSGYCSHGLGNEEDSWRYAMVVPGVLLLVMAFVYYRYTKDTPAGNLSELPERKASKERKYFFDGSKRSAYLGAYPCLRCLLWC